MTNPNASFLPAPRPLCKLWAGTSAVLREPVPISIYNDLWRQFFLWYFWCKSSSRIWYLRRGPSQVESSSRRDLAKTVCFWRTSSVPGYPACCMSLQHDTAQLGTIGFWAVRLHPLLTACYLLPTASYLLLPYLLLTAYCLLLAACCLLLDTYCCP